jgi:hypothetical protein
MKRLTSHTDMNYALRRAIMLAADKLADEVYDWNEERTKGEYEAMCENYLHWTLRLEHPEGIEPSN